METQWMKKDRICFLRFTVSCCESLQLYPVLETVVFNLFSRHACWRLTAFRVRSDGRREGAASTAGTLARFLNCFYVFNVSRARLIKYCLQQFELVEETAAAVCWSVVDRGAKQAQEVKPVNSGVANNCLVCSGCAGVLAYRGGFSHTTLQPSGGGASGSISQKGFLWSSRKPGT